VYLKFKRSLVIETPESGIIETEREKDNNMKAVVFVDVQKDFIDGALKNDKAIETTPKIVEFAKECVRQGYKLYATRDTHDASYLSTLEGKKLPVEHCIEGTDGWMIDNRLMEVLDGNCTFINKPTFGSFDLADIMNEDLPEWHGKHAWTKGMFDEIILAGFCTDICVVSHALLLRAKFPNTKITIKEDLCAGVTPESHNAALTTAKMCQIDVI